MQEKSPFQNYIAIPDADNLIAAHDGDMALLYLYWIRNGSLDAEKAAQELCRTLLEIRSAEEKLRRMGISLADDVRPAAAAVRVEPAPAEELPQYTASEITRRTQDDGAFAAILSEAAKVIGNALNSNETRVLFGIYDHLALPAEVILELLHYCKEDCERKYGQRRRPSAHSIEKEAYAWANQEILTLEQAEAYIQRQRELRDDLSRLQGALGLQGHALSPTQQKDLSAWLDQGFGEEAIVMAYDRTVTNTGALKWNYMRKILQSWHEKGLHKPEEILEKDSPYPKSTGRRASGKTEKPIDREALEELLKNT